VSVGGSKGTRHYSRRLNKRTVAITHRRSIVESAKPVDQPDAETVEVRQGTGPRQTVSVLFVSLLLAAVAGVVVLTVFAMR
jgi:hypothetical protein